MTDTERFAGEDTHGHHKHAKGGHAQGHARPSHGSHHHDHPGHGHHHHGHHDHHDEPMTLDEAVRSLLVLGQVALDAEDYESAAEAYASLLKLQQNEYALYNLASLYARGAGVRRNYLEAARLFHQAELMGNSKAGALCAKCMFDFVHTGIKVRSAMDVFAAMAIFVSRVYPEAEDAAHEVANGLMAIANTCYSKGEPEEAVKAIRAAAEHADNGSAQHYLGLLYYEGTLLPQNDLAALYWLDRAVDNGAAGEALQVRDGILDAYRQSLSEETFSQTMTQLADWCEQGTADVPADPERSARWRAFAG